MTPEQAKRRLRAAVEANAPAAWIRRHPFEALGIGIFAGLLYGASPRTANEAAESLLRLIVRCRAD